MIRSEKKIALVGNGNLAFHLAKRLWEIGVGISGLIVRNSSRAEAFKPFLSEGCVISDSSNFADHEWDIILIAVSESATSQVIESNEFPPEATIVHTSGSQSIDIFKNTGVKNFGVLYPLQTFSKEKEIDFSEVPVFIEANSEGSLKMISELAFLLSEKVSELSSEQRLKVHMAAVIACNFSNALYAIAENQLHGVGLDLDTIAPLIQETTQKAIALKPAIAQTGPASRGDLETMNKHLQLLDGSPEIKSIYEQLSKLILDTKLLF
ncbi:MAG: DUF2520 domain-containing protein [Cyclobacteriaceae bacterium]